MAKNGRPTLYKPEYAEALIKFFLIPPYEERAIEHYDSKGNVSWTDIKLIPNRMPTFLRFQMMIGISKQCFHDWIDKYPEFADAYTRAQELQKEFLIENGNRGIYNAAFTIFTAKNITDMRDKTEVEHTGSFSLTMLLDEANRKKQGQLGEGRQPGNSVAEPPK